MAEWWCIWAAGIQLEWGKSGFEGREMRICLHARVDYSGEKKEIEGGARYSRTHCGGWCIWAVGTQLGWGTLGFKGREVQICRQARTGYLGEKMETEPPGLEFCERIAGGGIFG